jgi:hypothetical protein
MITLHHRKQYSYLSMYNSSNYPTWYKVFAALLTVTCNSNNASSTRIPRTSLATRFTFLGLYNNQKDQDELKN